MEKTKEKTTKLGLLKLFFSLFSIKENQKENPSETLDSSEDDIKLLLDTVWDGILKRDMNADFFNEVRDAKNWLGRQLKEVKLHDLYPSYSDLEFYMEKILRGLEYNGTNEVKKIQFAIKSIEDYLSTENDEEKTEFESDLETAEQGDTYAQHKVRFSYRDGRRLPWSSCNLRGRDGNETRREGQIGARLNGALHPSPAEIEALDDLDYLESNRDDTQH